MPTWVYCITAFALGNIVGLITSYFIFSRTIKDAIEKQIRGMQGKKI